METNQPERQGKLYTVCKGERAGRLRDLIIKNPDAGITWSTEHKVKPHGFGL